MRLTLLIALSLLVGCAQSDEPATVSTDDDTAPAETVSFDGEWSIDVMPLDSDSVLTSFQMMASDGSEDWSIVFEHIDTPVVATASVDGASATAVFGPYSSALRDGITVDSVRMNPTVSDAGMEGTFTAHYADGQVTDGRFQGTR